MKPATEIIDLHVHIYPGRIRLAVWKYFEAIGWGVHREKSADVADTLAAHGVDRGVGLTYAHKKGVAAAMNRYMADVGEKIPFFIPFATIFPDDADFRETVDEAIASPRLNGFKIQPLVQCFDVNDARLDYFYRACIESSTPVVMHIGSGPVANEYVGPRHFARVMKRFPELRVCVAHMGAPEYDFFLNMLDDHPNMFLDTTMINTNTDLFDTRFNGSPDLLRRHADRVCFGSDWPNVPYPYQEALDSVARFELPEEALPGVFGGNARWFLRL